MCSESITNIEDELIKKMKSCKLESHNNGEYLGMKVTNHTIVFNEYSSEKISMELLEHNRAIAKLSL